MKIIKQDRKKIICVLGAPHSGTTVINNILNSMENAFCISEPHWVIQRNIKKLKLDKISNINFKSHNDFMKGLKKRLQESQYDFGGVKETYRFGEKSMEQPYKTILEMSDIIVFVYRKPTALYNSQKKIRPNCNEASNTKATQGLVNNFKKQCAVMSAYQEKAVNIVLEDLCTASNVRAIEYLNKVFEGKAEFTGKFVLNKTNFIFGNPKANHSKKLLPANMNISLVSEKEKKQLQPASKIYNSFRVKI